MYSIGLDFGTESCRAIIIDVNCGKVCGSTISNYRNSVIDKFLPNQSDFQLPDKWALQNPDDYIESMIKSVKKLLDISKISPDKICGLGIDFTSCTIIPTDEFGKPLSYFVEYKNNPHAWAKLWKHHSSDEQAKKITMIANENNLDWIEKYGGSISAEWLISKGLQILEEAPEIYKASKYFVEAGDWIVWQLTGKLIRNKCAAGYKGLWNEDNGYPDKIFLSKLNKDFIDFYDHKIFGEVINSGKKVSTLNKEFSELLGLNIDTIISSAIIDAHSAFIGVGISKPKKMMIILGTSACHIVLSEEYKFIKGISGIVKDGIIDGYYAYEGGQASFGDNLKWFVENLTPIKYFKEAENLGVSIYDLLEDYASKLDESKIISLDWFNGNRTPLVDSNLSGLIVGMNVTTEAPEIYLSLLESLAYGSKIILDQFKENGIEIEEIICSGGISKKSKLLMQILSDVTNRKISVIESDQASAIGAAILGALASGSKFGGYDNIEEAMLNMSSSINEVYSPNTANQLKYSKLFYEYKRLFHYFSKENNIMKTLN